MRGISSEAMVMCASSPEKVEILDPPAGCVVGERVVCAGYEGVFDCVCECGWSGVHMCFLNSVILGLICILCIF